LIFGPRITRKHQRCVFPPLGAHTPASKIFRISSFGTGSGLAAASTNNTTRKWSNYRGDIVRVPCPDEVLTSFPSGLSLIARYAPRIEDLAPDDFVESAACEHTGLLAPVLVNRVGLRPREI
jgi:hypothetical protein